MRIFFQIILDEVARNCVDISTNKVGTSVIQRCLRQGAITAIAPLVAKIISNAMILAEDQYGFDSTLLNYFFFCYIWLFASQI